MPHVALYYNLTFSDSFVKCSQSKAISLSSVGASNLLSISDKGDKKPKNCSIKVYVYDSLVKYFSRAQEYNLPTLSEEFQEFIPSEMKMNRLFKNRLKYKFLYDFALPIDLEVNCDIAKQWESLPEIEKEDLMHRFNVHLNWMVKCINPKEGLVISLARLGV